MAKYCVNPEFKDERSALIVSIRQALVSHINLFALACCLFAWQFAGCSRLDSEQWNMMGRRDDQELSKNEVQQLSEQAREIREAMIQTRKQNQQEQKQALEKSKIPDLDPDLEQVRLLKEMYEKTQDEQIRRMLVDKLPTLGSRIPKEPEAIANNDASQGLTQSNPTPQRNVNDQAVHTETTGSAEYRISDISPPSNSVSSPHQNASAVAKSRLNRLIKNDAQRSIAQPKNSARIINDSEAIVDEMVLQTTANERNQASGNLPAVRNAGYEDSIDEPRPHDNLDIESDPIQLGDWKRKLLETVSLLEQTKQKKELTESEQAYLEVSLRFLNLIQGNHDQAVAAIEGLTIEEQEYWKEQLFAMTRIIVDPSDDSTGVFVSRQKQAFRALEHLRNATSHLASIAALDVKNLHWCSRIDDFGQYAEVTSKTFSPGSPQLVYCELENWSIEETASSEGPRFVSKIQPSFVILNESREVVKQQEYAMLTDVSRNQRRDFHLTLPITIPKLPAGTYYLQLTVDDLVGDKAATSKVPLTFRIR